LVLIQLKLTKNIAQLQFEDGLAKEYRDLAARIPTSAFWGEVLTESEFNESRDEFFRYLDLSNEQIVLRMSGRISKGTWESWGEGIAANLQLPAFSKAWAEVKEKTNIFSELRILESMDFKSDPAIWKKKHHLRW
jgi:hypothetical protein